MIDGFGKDYLEASEMPNLKRLMARGFAKTVRGVMPSVTNVNNASIACGVWPEEHGITGNSFFDEAKGQAEYMENSAYLLRPTLFELAAQRGVKSALLTAKKKTVALFARGTELAIAAEAVARRRMGKRDHVGLYQSQHLNAGIDIVEHHAVALALPRTRTGCAAGDQALEVHAIYVRS